MREEKKSNDIIRIGGEVLPPIPEEGVFPNTARSLVFSGYTTNIDDAMKDILTRRAPTSNNHRTELGRVIVNNNVYAIIFKLHANRNYCSALVFPVGDSIVMYQNNSGEVSKTTFTGTTVTV